MKKTTFFLVFNLVFSLSTPLTIHADSYWKDTYQAVSNTAHYLVLRTSQSCQESGACIKEKITDIGSSILLWWDKHKPSFPIVVVYNK